MTKNHVSAEDLLTMAPADLDALPVDQLLLIQQEIIEEATKIKNIKTIYDSILNKRFTAAIAGSYNAKGENYGKTNFAYGDGYIIEVETPKNIKWDADEMKVGEKVIREDWDEDPDEYITIKRSIPEATYNVWPTAIQKVFSPARTVTAGKRKISIKLEESA